VNEGATTRYARGFLIYLLASIRLRRGYPGFNALCEALQDQPELLRTVSRRLAGNTVLFPPPALVEEILCDVRVYQATERPDTVAVAQLRRELGLTDREILEKREMLDREIQPHIQALLEMEDQSC